MSRNLPPNGTAALDRPLVKGCSLSPAPPAIIIASTLLIIHLLLAFFEVGDSLTTPSVGYFGFKKGNPLCHLFRSLSSVL